MVDEIVEVPVQRWVQRTVEVPQVQVIQKVRISEEK